MTRDELILRTRALVADGERIERTPTMDALRSWLAASDILLAEAWGTMDRYHLVWLSVGRPRDVVRERPMSPAEEATYVREIAVQKTAALRMSLDAVERQGMPFLGEDHPSVDERELDRAAEGGIEAGARPETAPLGPGEPGDGGGPAGGAGGRVPDPGPGGTIPGGEGAGGVTPTERADLIGAIRATGPDLAERIREARERTLSNDPSVVRRAPNPERMRR